VGVSLRVAFDTTPLRLTRAGTARYIMSLLPRLDGVRPIRFGGPGRLSVGVRELAWYPLALSLLGDADVLHCPTYYGPLRPRVPTVVTVHDLAVLRHPAAFPAWTRAYVPRVIPAVLRAATGVIAVSEFTAGELEELAGVSRDRVRVISNAVDHEVFTTEGPRAEGDYVFAVGTLEPRKNLERTIAATARLGVELRVAGDVGWGGVRPDGKHVRMLGYVDDLELARLYRGALCVAYPSLYEGFGIPVLEAMACGAAVVTSRGGACEEVADGTAELVDPLDVQAIAEGIETAIANGTGRGVERAAGFTWEETARLTRETYEEVAA
jgi:glycosyltransferase involved in cell wall biosynthesis